MTDIREFLRKINTAPTCMTKVNWKSETESFRYRRLRAIIVGIKDEDVCQLVREYIINAWCYTMSEPSDEIERRLDQCFEERKAKVMKILHKQALDNKARALNRAMPSCKTTESENEHFRLKEENERLKLELSNYESAPEYAINQAKTEGIRSVVEQLIIYAEGEELKVAREIRIALNTKLSNGVTPSDTLTKEWKNRLSALGRHNHTNSNNLSFGSNVGTVVAHADQVTLQYQENE